MSVAEDSVDNTAFISHSEFYKCFRTPFGFTNAPAAFQRELDLILAKYKCRTCLVYLDYIIIFSNAFEEHLSQLDELKRNAELA